MSPGPTSLGIWLVILFFVSETNNIFAVNYIPLLNIPLLGRGRELRYYASSSPTAVFRSSLFEGGSDNREFVRANHPLVSACVTKDVPISHMSFLTQCRVSTVYGKRRRLNKLLPVFHSGKGVS